MTYAHSLWNKQQDQILKQFGESGRPWIEIIGLLSGRTVSACQTRYNTFVKAHTGRRRASVKNPNLQKRFVDRYNGDAIAGDHYIFKVPEGDPLLQRLTAVHGRDKIDRNFDVTKGLRR